MEIRYQGRASDTVCSLGVTGACIYFMSRVTTTQEKVKGLLKGLVWLVILVNDALKALHKE